MKKKTLILWICFTLILLIGLQLIGFGQSLDAKVIKKEKLLEEKLKAKGLKADFVRISGKRSKWFNDLLSLSTKNSFHLSGKAIDILVGDINNDRKQNETDVKLVVACLEEIEKENPDLVGGIGTYLNQGAWSKKMVHFDVRGYKARWNK
jgi:uncharacterized protein YcbK (DUF882 family)